ncbi:MAG: hypothetical protein ACYDBQ_01610 [Thermoplasmatota archaeon]
MPAPPHAATKPGDQPTAGAWWAHSTSCMEAAQSHAPAQGPACVTAVPRAAIHTTSATPRGAATLHQGTGGGTRVAAKRAGAGGQRPKESEAAAKAGSTTIRGQESRPAATSGCGPHAHRGRQGPWYAHACATSCSITKPGRSAAASP